MKDEALKLALAALECKDGWGSSIRSQKERAITAIKQARALDKMVENARELGLDYEPVQEPVAWTVSGKITDWSKDFSAYQTKHYTRPVYTPHAAQRQWVGLTDEDKDMCIQATVERGSADELIAAIEAKLKEKNT